MRRRYSPNVLSGLSVFICNDNKKVIRQKISLFCELNGIVLVIYYLQTSGWLNLMANVIDNFTHGLAVAGSYCAGTKVKQFD